MSATEGHWLGRNDGRRRYDLDRLKRVVATEQVLCHYGLGGGPRPVQGELVGPCPLPGHARDRSNRRAFSANSAKALWRCFTSCGGGDVVDLVRRAGEVDFAEAAPILAALADGVAPGPQRPFADPTKPAGAFTPYTRRLLDGDAAGRAGAQRLALALAPTHVDIVELPDRVDPADLGEDELRGRLAHLLSQPVPTGVRSDGLGRRR